MDVLTLLQPLVSEIDIDSAYGPPIRITNPFAPAAPSGGGGVDPMSLLQPQITIRFNDGSDPVVIAPWGTPPMPSRWTTYVDIASVGGVLIGGFALYGLVHWFREKKRRK